MYYLSMNVYFDDTNFQGSILNRGDRKLMAEVDKAVEELEKIIDRISAVKIKAYIFKDCTSEYGKKVFWEAMAEAWELHDQLNMIASGDPKVNDFLCGPLQYKNPLVLDAKIRGSDSLFKTRIMEKGFGELETVSLA